MKNEFYMPLGMKEKDFTEEHLQKWKNLSKKEKWFYRYMIENDTGLSSILVGVISAYVVNSLFGMAGMEWISWWYMIMYCLNFLMSVWCLVRIIRLYGVHIRKERRDEEDSDTVYLNKSFSWIYENCQLEVQRILDRIWIPFLGMLITLLMCFLIRNNFIITHNNFNH